MDETCGLFEAMNKMPLPALSIASVDLFTDLCLALFQTTRKAYWGPENEVRLCLHPPSSAIKTLYFVISMST